jgi:hypothetical protein
LSNDEQEIWRTEVGARDVPLATGTNRQHIVPVGLDELLEALPFPPDEEAIPIGVEHFEENSPVGQQEPFGPRNCGQCPKAGSAEQIVVDEPNPERRTTVGAVPPGTMAHHSYGCFASRR